MLKRRWNKLKLKYAESKINTSKIGGVILEGSSEELRSAGGKLLLTKTNYYLIKIFIIEALGHVTV